jgi:hypothetical protein
MQSQGNYQTAVVPHHPHESISPNPQYYKTPPPSSLRMGSGPLTSMGGGSSS